MKRILFKTWDHLAEHSSYSSYNANERINNQDGLDKKFDEIRSFYDSEVPEAIQDLAKENNIYILHALITWPKLYSFSKFLMSKISKLILKKKILQLKTTISCLRFVKNYIALPIIRNFFKSFSTSFTSSEGLDRRERYFFISNHRDILLDTLLLDSYLYSIGHGCAEMAIGDNLLENSAFQKVLRILRCFVVKRNVKGNKELFNSFKLLSEYIRTKYQNRRSIWIAQASGRSKDWTDKTSVALLKMIYLAWKKDHSFSEMLQQIKIIPVTINYEYLPADKQFAQELRDIAEKGTYTKGEGEDYNSILEGVIGFKGNLNYNFGTVVPATIETPEELAEYLDQQIHLGYFIYNCNLMAYKMQLKNRGEDVNYVKLKSSLQVKESDFYDKIFQKRINKLSPKEIPYILSMYAQPVILKLEALDKKSI